ncbi:hypothetical protein AB0F64_12765 [Streptomyces sp. NPDC026294]|uniref:hypothetical protein n=1 Tax=Streptomyces sp. NPDC026294 TaxID=3155362 RepID=UPI0033D542E3
MPQTLTVGQLIRQLQTAHSDLPVYLAINPDWPYAHRLERVVAVSDAPQGAVYIAEYGQAGVLPPAVRTELEWATD